MSVKVEQFEVVIDWWVQPGSNGLVDPQECDSLVELAAKSGATLEGVLQAPDLFRFCARVIDLTIQAKIRDGCIYQSPNKLDVNSKELPHSSIPDNLAEGAVLL